MTSQMWYNIPVTQSGTGRFLMSSADDSIAYCYWVKHPVLLDSRPADCVTTSASNTGCFAMSRDWACVKCGGFERNKKGDCKVCAREYAKKWRAKPENKDVQRQWNREGYARNPGKKLEGGRRWRKENPDKALAISRRITPDEAIAKVHRRNAKKKKNGGSYTAAEWRAMCIQYDNRCLACGRSDVKLTVDHVIPLVHGGTNSIDNIQPLCGPCNLRKATKTIDYRPSSGVWRWIQRKLFGD